MFMSKPENGGTKVYLNFEQALEIIKIIDEVTCEAPKIIYLVGWQYNGHDDRYPDFFEVNPALARNGEPVKDNLIWLKA